MTVLGRVTQLWVFPVKSMSGAPVESATVTFSGLAGDRAWAVVDGEGRVVTAREEPRLRECVARIVDGELEVDVPGAGPRQGADQVSLALCAWLGRDVRLDHREGQGFVDVAPVHLVSTRSVADAGHAEECDACDVTAPRANIVVDLQPGSGAERTWVGDEVVAGQAGLTVVRLPQHCLGAYADVTAPGRLSVGDEIRTG